MISFIVIVFYKLRNRLNKVFWRVVIVEPYTPRQRGGNAKLRGISNEQVAVIVTADRVSEIDMTVARLERIKKADIQKAIGERVSEQTILCSDSHVCYKGFARDR